MSTRPPKTITTTQKILLIGAFILSVIGAGMPFVSFFIHSSLFSHNPMLEQAVLSDADVIAWTAQTVVAAGTFDPTNIDAVMEAARGDFTPAGWDDFALSLAKNKIVETIKAGQRSINLTVEEMPKISEAQAQKGVYAWILSMPVTITFTGDNPPPALHNVLQVTVVRSAAPENKKGVAIAHWATGATAAAEKDAAPHDNSILGYSAH